MEVTLDPKNIDDYRRFLQIKSLPVYRIRGRQAWFPDEYAQHIGLQPERARLVNWEPSGWLFDYQRAIVNIAIRKRKFAVFADCGLGKSLILLEYAQAAQQNLGNRRGTLIVAPLMVVGQLQQEVERFYGDRLPVERVKAKDLQAWLNGCGGKIGITNYDALKDDIQPGRLGALIADESSMLKSHYGKWGTTLIRLGKGLEWKLALTGTPAPNDRIEYANHAVFLDQFPTVNAFLATYFINRGQTDNRWELKPHALRPFYRALSHWSIFLTNPATYGWKDNCESIPPIYSHIHDVPLTDEQLRIIGRKTGELFATNLGGITSRAAMGQIAKGFYKGKAIATNKPSYIADLLSQWPDESTIIWCIYDEEQNTLAKSLPDAASMDGKTKLADRLAMIRDFKSGSCKTLISKAKILGFGLNLQIATRQVFSGLQDCFDETTEVLTRDGWINFGELTAGHSVATVNPNSLTFEWQSPTKVVWEPYVGPMVRFQGQRNFDLLVTPNHRMFVKRCNKRFPSDNRGWHFRYANEIAESFRRQELRMQSCPLGGFVGRSPEFIENDNPPSNDNHTHTKTIATLTTSDAVKLAAWYLTEGHCRPKGSYEFGRIVISQTEKNPEHREEIIKLLTSIAGSVNTKTKDITCYSRHLAGWLLKEFGHGSYFKSIPSWMKELDSNYLTLLRDTMMKGDGISGGRSYRTASKKLADDFQEVCLKTGWRASVKRRIGACAAYPNDEVFDVTIARENTQPAIHRPPTIEHYAGMIGCATVPNGTLIVRRNGIPAITGNSYESYYQCVKRSNRYGSTKPLNVHIPITDIEAPMVETVLRKAARVQQDTEEQERLFKEVQVGDWN